jgi:hypothetical protein
LNAERKKMEAIHLFCLRSTECIRRGQCYKYFYTCNLQVTTMSSVAQAGWPDEFEKKSPKICVCTKPNPFFVKAHNLYVPSTKNSMKFLILPQLDQNGQSKPPHTMYVGENSPKLVTLGTGTINVYTWHTKCWREINIVCRYICTYVDLKKTLEMEKFFYKYNTYKVIVNIYSLLICTF